MGKECALGNGELLAGGVLRNSVVRLGHHFFIFCFTDFFCNKFGLEDDIRIKIKFIRTIFQLN